jgi:membrane-associated phospholipid phosphatase
MAGVCMVAPFILNFNYNLGYEGNVIIAESYLLTMSLAYFSKTTYGRKRPYVYNENIDMRVRQSKDGRYSFFSAHTAMAFTGAILTAKMYDDLSDGKHSTFIYTGAVAVATCVGVLRITAGKHFLTDVVVGAIVGTGIALLLTELHLEQRGKLSSEERLSRTLPIINYSILF